MDDELDQLLRSLKLQRLRKTLDAHLNAAQRDGLAYSEFLRQALRDEHHDQQVRFLEYRIQRARLPERWTLETFPWDRQPGVRQAVIRQLATLDFLNDGTNLVFIGPTGVGKTGLASGLLMKAMLEGRRARFIKAQELFDELFRSLADRSSRRLLNKLACFDVLLIDEMGYLNLQPEQSNIFFKLMEERYRRKLSTLITTNLDYEEWYAFLGQKAMVAALLDRLRHRCNTLRIDGSSLRTPSQMS